MLFIQINHLKITSNNYTIIIIEKYDLILFQFVTFCKSIELSSSSRWRWWEKTLLQQHVVKLTINEIIIIII